MSVHIHLNIYGIVFEYVDSIEKTISHSISFLVYSFFFFLICVHMVGCYEFWLIGQKKMRKWEKLSSYSAKEDRVYQTNNKISWRIKIECLFF